ncbi:alpha/beta hydrolase [Flammeovirgaceae bacterium SG7u.111]|nr:alpha/beta hydrolase [Flammeovirgaceae bacterium SG7u.132]WPO33745.1 alpha/beta hydrolase [Flammeovirgaceae bacterium SG7u.111]
MRFFKITRRIILLLLSFLYFTTASGQERIMLWKEGALPNSKGVEVKDSINNERLFQVDKPWITPFFTSNQENKGAAVLIIPGGGYHHLSFNISGYQMAKWFNTLGMNAFVLSHRLPLSPDLVKREIAPLQDAQRAMQIIRANAEKWGIDTTRVGVWGASAGGHLAASLSTIQEDYTQTSKGQLYHSYRPDFTILISPVIDLGEFAHRGSRDNLLGENPSKELVQKFSLQNQVSEYTPPTFVCHAFNDTGVSPQNSMLFFNALMDKGIASSSLHIFPQGGHNIALRNNPGSTNLWTQLCESWLIETHIINENIKK